MPANHQFTTGLVATDAISFEASFREACAANRCLHYAKSWSCPPAIGEVENLRARVRAYSRGVVIRTQWPLDDEFDFEGMLSAARKHDEVLIRIEPELRARYAAARSLLLGAGPCPRCRACTYPAAPCRHPDTLLSSLEAYAIDVARLAAAAHLEYQSQPKTVAYFGLFLFSTQPTAG